MTEQRAAELRRYAEEATGQHMRVLLDADELLWLLDRAPAQSMKKGLGEGECYCMADTYCHHHAPPVG